jgi:hypothetical protein
VSTARLNGVYAHGRRCCNDRPRMALYYARRVVGPNAVQLGARLTRSATAACVVIPVVSSLIHAGAATYVAGCHTGCHELWLGWSQGVLAAVVVLNILAEVWKAYHEANRWKAEHARSLTYVLLCRTFIVGGIVLCAVAPYYGKVIAVLIVVPSVGGVLHVYKTALS